MLDLGSIELRGRAVTLRPLATSDAQALATAAAESRDSYGFTPVPEGLEQTQAYVAKALRARERGERYPFAIEWRGRIAGSTSYVDYQPWSWPPGCDLGRTDRPDALEIGHTWLAASAQRTPCNTEAKLLLLEHAFERFCVHRVTILTDERNTRSRRAIERLGAAFEGIRRAHKPSSDCTVRNSAMYSIVASEWPGVRDRLRALLETR
jgi:RimJ/RimL family protein N-acetyltransferase